MRRSIPTFAVAILTTSTSIFAARDWSVEVIRLAPKQPSTCPIVVDIYTSGRHKHDVLDFKNEPTGGVFQDYSVSTTQPSDFVRVTARGDKGCDIEIELSSRDSCDPKINSQSHHPYVSEINHITGKGDVELKRTEKEISDGIAGEIAKRTAAYLAAVTYNTVTGSGLTLRDARRDAEAQLPRYTDGPDSGMPAFKDVEQTDIKQGNDKYYVTLKYMKLN